MFLRSPPGEWTLLRLLGPWPWYVVSAAGVALVLLTLLDAPFWPQRRRASTASARARLPGRRPLGPWAGTHPGLADTGSRPQSVQPSPADVDRRGIASGGQCP